MSMPDSDLDSKAVNDLAPHAVGADIIVGALLAARMPLAETWILDAGCGGGTYARAVVEHVGHIDAIDPSEANVARARARLWRYERAGRVALHHGDLKELPFDDGMFDAVMTNQALYRLENGVAGYPGHRKALAEFNRVLRPGGVLVVNATTHRQIRNGFWFHALLPAAMETALRVCAPSRELIDMFAEAGFDFRGRTVPLDLLVGGGDGHARWLTEPPLHRVEPFWAHAPAEEVEAAMNHIAAMVDAGRMDSFILENDAGRLQFGQFTFFIAHKPA